MAKKKSEKKYTAYELVEKFRMIFMGGLMQYLTEKSFSDEANTFVLDMIANMHNEMRNYISNSTEPNKTYETNGEHHQKIVSKLESTLDETDKQHRILSCQEIMDIDTAGYMLFLCKGDGLFLSSNVNDKMYNEVMSHIWSVMQDNN